MCKSAIFNSSLTPRHHMAPVFRRSLTFIQFYASFCRKESCSFLASCSKDNDSTAADALAPPSSLFSTSDTSVLFLSVGVHRQADRQPTDQVLPGLGAANSGPWGKYTYDVSVGARVEDVALTAGLCPQGTTAESWELIRRETKLHLEQLHMLAASLTCAASAKLCWCSAALPFYYLLIYLLQSIYGVCVCVCGLWAWLNLKQQWCCK